MGILLLGMQQRTRVVTTRKEKLTLPELDQITGGAGDPSIKTVMRCGDCNYTYEWMGNYVGRYF